MDSMHGEFTPATSWRTGLIVSARHPASRIVQFAVIDEFAVFEADIVLGTVDEVEGALLAVSEDMTGGGTGSGVVVPVERRWPDGLIIYAVDGGDEALGSRVPDAIAHWEANTCIRFCKRTTEPDYVLFRAGSGCRAQVGKKEGGGMQSIWLGPGCTTGNVIHEIGHAVGLWHEQSREDRDAWIQIVWDKIDPFQMHNFDQHIIDGDDVGGYDFESIMHYPKDAFSIDGSDTIVPRITLPSGVTMGQRSGLSVTDIATVQAMYAGRCAGVCPA